MNGSVQYDYLLNDVDVLEFINLHKMVTRLSKQQQKQSKEK